MIATLPATSLAAIAIALISVTATGRIRFRPW
jgi:hypothetical protein